VIQIFLNSVGLLANVRLLRDGSFFRFGAPDLLQFRFSCVKYCLILESVQQPKISEK